MEPRNRTENAVRLRFSLHGGWAGFPPHWGVRGGAFATTGPRLDYQCKTDKGNNNNNDEERKDCNKYLLIIIINKVPNSGREREQTSIRYKKYR